MEDLSPLLFDLQGRFRISSKTYLVEEAFCARAECNHVTVLNHFYSCCSQVYRCCRKIIYRGPASDELRSFDKLLHIEKHGIEKHGSISVKHLH